MEDVAVIDRFLACLFAAEVDEAHSPQHQPNAEVVFDSAV